MSPRTKSTSQECSTRPAQFSFSSLFKRATGTRKHRNRVRQARGRRNVVESLESRRMLAVVLEFIPDTGTVTVENGKTVVTVAPDTSIGFSLDITGDSDFMMSAYQLNFSDSSTDLDFNTWAEFEDGPDGIPFNADDIFFAFKGDSDIVRDGSGQVLVSASNNNASLFVDMPTGVTKTIGFFNVVVPTAGGNYDLISGELGVPPVFSRTVILKDIAATEVPISDYGNITIRVQEPGQPVGNVDSATVPEDSSDNSIPVLANDTDPEGDTLTIVSVESFSNGGSATINGAAVDYTPAADFAGTETFTYTMTDGNTTPVTVAVSVMVTNSNDTPVTVADNISLDEDSSFIFDADLETTSNDIDVDGDVITMTNLTGVV
ncbi:MAG: hypothetical protein ACI9HK_004935, partial [Pirellulaceae bacterium]